MIAIGKLVSPKNITFVSRILNNRFCLFLASKQILDNLMDMHRSIVTNNQELQIRRLNNPVKRIVISNVCPSIPNQIILDHLKTLNITPVSQISHLKAGIFAEGYDHILSFRRQMFIKHDDITKIPSSLLINTNDSQFRIFFTDDKITCFICNSTGHTSSTCKKTNSIISKISPPLLQVNEAEMNLILENTQIDPLENTQLPIKSPPGINPNETISNWNNDTEFTTNKRQAPPTTSSSAPTSPSYTNPQMPSLPDTKNQRKKIKTTDQTISTDNISTSQENDFIKPEITNIKANCSRSNSRKRFVDNLDTHLDPIKHIFDKTNQTSVNFLQFKHIIENIATLEKPLDIIHEYETTGNHILTILEKIRPLLITNAKNNITRITNKLFKAIGDEAHIEVWRHNRQ